MVWTNKNGVYVFCVQTCVCYIFSKNICTVKWLKKGSISRQICHGTFIYIGCKKKKKQQDHWSPNTNIDQGFESKAISLETQQKVLQSNEEERPPGENTMGRGVDVTWQLLYKVLDVKLGSSLKVMWLFSQVGYGENDLFFPNCDRQLIVLLLPQEQYIRFYRCRYQVFIIIAPDNLFVLELVALEPSITYRWKKSCTSWHV